MLFIIIIILGKVRSYIFRRLAKRNDLTPFEISRWTGKLLRPSWLIKLTNKTSWIADDQRNSLQHSIHLLLDSDVDAYSFTTFECSFLADSFVSNYSRFWSFSAPNSPIDPINSLSLKRLLDLCGDLHLPHILQPITILTYSILLSHTWSCTRFCDPVVLKRRPWLSTVAGD